MKPEGKGIWKGLSSIAFIISAIVLGFGLDKMFNYDSGEYYPYVYHNAYVGGDAYNYIINSNYATGFFVLAAMFALMGIGFIVLYYLSKMVDGQGKLRFYWQTVENGESELVKETEASDSFETIETECEQDNSVNLSE